MESMIFAKLIEQRMCVDVNQKRIVYFDSTL